MAISPALNLNQNVPPDPNAANHAGSPPATGPGGERPDDILTIRNRITGLTRQIARSSYSPVPTDEVVNAQPNPARSDLQPAASTTPTAPQPAAGLPGDPGANNGSGTPLTQGAAVGNAAGLTTDGKTPATGPWIRITPHDGVHGDELGTDVVRYDSQLGQAARANNKPFEWIQAHTDSYGHEVPPDLNVSDQFQNLVSKQGYRVVSVDYLAPGQPDNPFKMPAYHATMMTPTGATGVFTFTSNQRTDARPEDSTQRAPFMQMTGTPDKFTGGSTEQQAALEAAQAREADARTALAAAQTPGAQQDAAQKALENAERQKNLIAYGTAVTNKDIQGQFLTAAQTVNTGVNSQVAAAGANNQAYNSALQYYRDQGNDEATAQRLAQDYAVNQAHIDNDNNTLVANAGKSVLDNATAVRAQDVSLDNTRLQAAGQNVKDSAGWAANINDYLPHGSHSGGDAFAAMLGLNELLAKKYGALQDYAHPEVPVGLAGLANTPVTRLGQLPSTDEINATRQNMITNMGLDGRPQPPGAPNIQVPQANPVGVKAGVNPSTAITPPGPPPAIVKPPVPGSTPSTPAEDNSKNGPDDLLTLKDQQGNVVPVMRDVYELHPEMYQTKAENGQPAYTVANAQANPYRGTQYRPDDILTLNDGRTMSRYDWDNKLKRDPQFNVVNTEANPARTAGTPTAPGQDTPPTRSAPTTLDPTVPKPSDAALESRAQNPQPTSLVYQPTTQLDTSPGVGVQATNNLVAQAPPQRRPIDTFGDGLMDNPQAIESLFDINNDPRQYFQ